MSPEGILKCDSAELSGTFKCGSSHYIYVEDGKIKGGAKDLFTESQYGYIDYSAIVRNVSTGMRHHGMNVNSDCIVLRAKELATIASTDESVCRRKRNFTNSDRSESRWGWGIVLDNPANPVRKWNHDNTNIKRSRYRREEH